MGNICWHGLILAALCYMVMVGCHTAETRERDRFNEIFEVRKQMVLEKVRSARIELDKINFNGTVSAIEKANES